MESSFLSEGCNTSILRTELSSATTILSTGYRPLGSCSRAAGWSAATLCSGPSRSLPTLARTSAVGVNPTSSARCENDARDPERSSSLGCASKREATRRPGDESVVRFALHGMTPWEGRMAIHIRRREFISTLCGVVVVRPLAARAQQPKVPTIGALVIGNISPEEFWREFRQGLRDLGYIEGQNIRFEFRSAEGQIDRLPELAAELVRLKVDVIVTWFTPTAVAARQATREIPIVMAETGDPIGTGLVMSLRRPGGNVTGIASVTAELAGKSVQLIRDMLPSARRVTAL